MPINNELLGRCGGCPLPPTRKLLQLNALRCHFQHSPGYFLSKNVISKQLKGIITCFTGCRPGIKVCICLAILRSACIILYEALVERTKTTAFTFVVIYCITIEQRDNFLCACKCLLSLITFFRGWLLLYSRDILLKKLHP